MTELMFAPENVKGKGYTQKDCVDQAKGPWNTGYLLLPMWYFVLEQYKYKNLYKTN